MMDHDTKACQISHVIVGISILLLIAAIHVFRVGSYLKGELYLLYYSYASDIMIPFGMYYLLSINEVQIRFLRKWQIKALAVFGIATFTEIMQYFGIYVLGVTFDSFDIVMFGLGVLLAVFIDKQIFKRFIPFWDLNRLNR